MSNKANIDQLGEIHAGVAKWCIAKLEEEVPVMTMTPQGPVDTGIRKKAAVAADIAQMRAFLNDNKVTADVDTNKGLGELKGKLAHKQKRSNVAQLGLPTSLPELKAVRNGN